MSTPKGLAGQENSNSSRLQKARILFVDDEKDIAETMEFFLRESFTEVTALTSAQEALECHRAQPFDVIFSDLNMPRMNGIEFLREIRKTDLHTPFVLVTAYSDDKAETSVFKDGPIEFISKPFDPDFIVKVAQRHLR